MHGLGTCCLFAAFFPVFVGVWIATVNWRKPRFYRLWIGASVPASPFAFFACYILLGFSGELYSRFFQPSATVVFRQSFGFDPPVTVTIAKSSSYTDLNGHHATHLQFHSDQLTIDRITGSKWKRVASLLSPHDASDPGWWQSWRAIADNVNGWQKYELDVPFEKQHGYDFEHEVLIYDSQSKEAFYRFLGWNDD